MTQKRKIALAFAALAFVWAPSVVAQTPVTSPVTVLPTEATPLPMPVIAQAAETLSARTQVRLDQLSRELTETIGRVEALEANGAALKSENERLAGLLDATRAAQLAPAVVTADAANAPSARAESAAAMAMSAPTEAPMFVVASPPPIAPNIMLTNAQTALQSGNYPVAEVNLTQLIWTHPVSPEASEGRWLLGEARFVQSAWGTAAQAYVDYLKVSPQGPRASEALLRLAGSFRQLGDNRQRCVALSEFRRRTPRPDATLKARADAEIARTPCPPA